MKMDKFFFECITDCLGSKNERYFSSGFKHIDVIYNDMIFNDNVLSSNITVKTVGTWSQKNGKSLKPHLGTTEFVSIAAMMAQHLLVKELNLTEENLKVSWISRFTCKIRQCTEIDYNCLPATGKIVSTSSCIDLFRSIIQVQIGSVQATLHVCHSKRLFQEACNYVDHAVDFYHKGYKLREHAITDVILDEDKMTSSGNVAIYEEKIQRKGIGAKYPGMTLTDFVLVTGQLTQALLYSLNNSKRKDNNNLWLREIDVWCEFPPTVSVCNSEVKFLNVNIININNETWQSVLLSGNLGNMKSKIKVAQKLNQIS